MSDWQPIETAPKDGTTVDLRAKAWRADNDTFEYKRFVDYRWTTRNRDGRPGWSKVSEGLLGRVCVGEDFPPHWYVTHWMPLPPTPQEGE